MNRTLKILIVAVTFPIWMPVCAVLWIIALPCCIVWDIASNVVDGKDMFGVDDGGY